MTKQLRLINNKYSSMMNRKKVKGLKIDIKRAESWSEADSLGFEHLVIQKTPESDNNRISLVFNGPPCIYLTS